MSEFCILTVSKNKTCILQGRCAGCVVTSRVANNLFFGVSLVVPVSALMRDVLPQLVYPTMATDGM